MGARGIEVLPFAEFFRDPIGSTQRTFDRMAYASHGPASRPGGAGSSAHQDVRFNTIDFESREQYDALPRDDDGEGAGTGTKQPNYSSA